MTKQSFPSIANPECTEKKKKGNILDEDKKLKLLLKVVYVIVYLFVSLWFMSRIGPPCFWRTPNRYSKERSTGVEIKGNKH